jgi:hypothetical protein
MVGYVQPEQHNNVVELTLIKLRIKNQDCLAWRIRKGDLQSMKDDDVLFFRHWREIPAAVLGLFRDAAARASMREGIAGLPPNRAVYEVIDAIAREAGVTPSSQR